MGGGETVVALRAKPLLAQAKAVRNLMDDDIDLLRKIIARGWRKYTTSAIDRSGYQRLVDAGWLTVFRIDGQEMIYEVTRAGRAAGKAIG